MYQTAHTLIVSSFIVYSVSHTTLQASGNIAAKVSSTLVLDRSKIPMSRDFCTARVFEFRRTELVSGTVLSIDDGALSRTPARSVTLDLESIRNTLRATRDPAEPGEWIDLRMILTTATSFSAGAYRTLLDAPFSIRRVVDFA